MTHHDESLQDLDQQTALPKTWQIKVFVFVWKKDCMEVDIHQQPLATVNYNYRGMTAICIETRILCVWVRGTLWQDSSTHVPRLELMDIQCIRVKNWIISYARKISLENEQTASICSEPSLAVLRAVPLNTFMPSAAGCSVKRLRLPPPVMMSHSTGLSEMFRMNLAQAMKPRKED